MELLVGRVQGKERDEGVGENDERGGVWGVSQLVHSTLRDELARDEERSSIWASLLNQALGRFSYEVSTAEKTRAKLTNIFSPNYLG